MKNLLSIIFIVSMTAYGQNCNCDHFISLADSEVDGNVLAISPGDIVCVENGTRNRLKFKNISGTANNPIIIKNCGGQVNIIPTTYSYGMKIENCDNVQFSGTGDPQIEYGFKISQTSGYGITIGKLTNHFEIDHFLFEQTGNYAIYYKNNPVCDLSANKGEFTLENSKLHHLKIVNSYKGIRIGHPDYDLGVNNSSCGALQPHSIENLSLTHLIFENITNGDAIRLYGATANISDNTINTVNGRGVTIGTHCDITFMRNSVSNTNKEGIRALGSGSYQIHNNVFFNNGDLTHSAIEFAFENSLADPFGNQLSLSNNTIVNSELYNLSVLNPINATNNCKITNNVFLNPGATTNSQTHSPYLNIADFTYFEISNNALSTSPAALKFVDYDTQNFRLTHESPLINSGLPTITTLDFDNEHRNLAGQVDIGAFEYIPERIAYFNQIDLQGLYVNDFKYILGDTNAENQLLQYALDSGFNYLLLYNLTYIHSNLYDITNPAEAIVFANFIEKAKTEYGMVQVGVVGEKNESFDKIETFNNLYNSNWHQTVDVLNLEFEFWANVNNNTFDYYCSTYLTPNSHTCTNDGAFDYSYPQMVAIDDRAQNMGCISEIYLGNTTSAQLLAISEVTDRVLLHYYKTSDTYNNGNSIYNYKTYRLQDIVNSERQPAVMPIFSARPNHMGPWLNNHSITQPMDTWLNGQNSFDDDASAQSLKIAGYQWYRYTDLIPSTNKSSSQNDNNNADDNGHLNQIELEIPSETQQKIQISPNPFSQYTTIILEGDNNDYLVEVTDVSGKNVFSKFIINENQVNIERGDLTQGMYMLTITNNLTGDIIHNSKLVIVD